MFVCLSGTLGGGVGKGLVSGLVNNDTGRDEEEDILLSLNHKLVIIGIFSNKPLSLLLSSSSSSFEY